MAVPELWIVAGPNGAGKTTCVQKEPIARLLPGVAFLNPDDRTLLKLRSNGYSGFADSPVEVQARYFIESSNEVFAEIEQMIENGMPVGVETVLSTEKYRPVVERVIDRKGFVGLIYVALSSPALAQERVAARVQRGGHGVPADKIVERWQRSLTQLRWFRIKATAFWVIDNSDSDPEVPPRLLASGKLGVVDFLDDSTFAAMKTALE